MFGVAISRVRDLDSLQIVNFRKDCVKAPVRAVLDFNQDLGIPTEENSQLCCRNVIVNAHPEIVKFQSKCI